MTQAPHFEFDQYENQYATGGNKKQKSIFDDFGEDEKPAYPKAQSQAKNSQKNYRGEDEGIGYGDFGNFNGFSGFVSPDLQQESQENYGQKASPNQHITPQNNKKQTSVADSSLQANGFGDDFLNFDLLGDVGSKLQPG